MKWNDRHADEQKFFHVLLFLFPFHILEDKQNMKVKRIGLWFDIPFSLHWRGFIGVFSYLTWLELAKERFESPRVLATRAPGGFSVIGCGERQEYIVAIHSNTGAAGRRSSRSITRKAAHHLRL